MKKEQLYISTIDDQAGALASKYGLGLELAEYCTAWNMDEKFTETDKRIRQETVGISRLLLLYLPVLLALRGRSRYVLTRTLKF